MQTAFAIYSVGFVIFVFFLLLLMQYMSRLAFEEIMYYNMAENFFFPEQINDLPATKSHSNITHNN